MKLSHDAVIPPEKLTSYLLVEGALVGPTGTLDVGTVWIERAVDEELRFITLKPRR